MDLLTRVDVGGSFSEEKARPLVRQLLSAVAHMHACDLVHLDIKLDNILLDENEVLKLCDFGHASIATADRRLRGMCGTAHYAAPECRSEFGDYDGRAADAWSIGICVFCMIRGRFPFDPKQLYSSYTPALAALADRENLPLSSEMPPALDRVRRVGFTPPLLQLLDNCITFEPTHRLSAAKTLNLEWLRACTDTDAD